MLTSISVDEILLLRYVNLSTNFRCLPLKVEVAPFRLIDKNSVSFVSMLSPKLAPGYSVEIRLGYAYLREALDHLSCLCLY